MKIYKLISQFIHSEDITAGMEGIPYFSQIVGYYTDMELVQEALMMVYELRMDSLLEDDDGDDHEVWISYHVEVIEPNETFVGFFTKIYYENSPVDGIFNVRYMEEHLDFEGEDTPRYNIGDIVVYHPDDTEINYTKVGIVSKLPSTSAEHLVDPQNSLDSYEILLGFENQHRVMRTSSHISRLPITDQSIEVLSQNYCHHKLSEFKRLFYMRDMLNARLQYHLNR